MYDLQEFLSPINVAILNDDNAYNETQFGSIIKIHEDELPVLDGIELVIVGINEFRGAGFVPNESAADNVRKQFYQLYYWHKDIRIADIGNIKIGASINDSYAAIKMVLKELLLMGKTIIILGGSHDNTMGQYFAYKDMGRIIDATVVDARIDLKSESSLRSENFLMEMLTGEPNMVRHYNHIGFQSYFVHPHMLETIDKLRFDCFRVGTAKEQLEEMEPVIRSSDLVSIDISAIKNSDAPASISSPNGFTGEEACSLARYAGMSSSISSFGIYGYDADKDLNDLTALQISQMLWYFIDGKNRSKQEAAIEDREHFNEYYTSFTEVESVFLQSKKTSRWWMQLPNKKFIPCSYKDYVSASQNEIPERWLRAQERE